MRKKRFNIWHLIYISIIAAGIMIFIFAGIINDAMSIARNGYKQGQIDCLNGIQNYDKVATKDSVYIKIR